MWKQDHAQMHILISKTVHLRMVAVIKLELIPVEERKV